MAFKQRLRAGASAAFKHLAMSALVASLVGFLVFGFWYPAPFGDLAGGHGLFWLIVGVDMVCGPLLTLVIFNPSKPRAELVRDIGIVVLIQLAALLYGLGSLAQARPVWVAYEGNRFRVVSVPDLADQNLDEAPESLRQLSWTGPKLLGVKLVESTDKNFQQSIQDSLAGIHPAFRPSRWQTYESQLLTVSQALQPIELLLSRQPAKTEMVRAALQGQRAEAFGYLPLVSENATDWVVIVRRESAQPLTYLHVDGF